MKNQKTEEKDLSKKWKLVKIENQNISVSEAITLEINQKEGQFSGFAGCNRIGGGFQIMGENISFPDVYSTLMFCEPEFMNIEDKYTSLLEKVVSFELSEKTLTLFDKNKKEILYFEL